MYKLFEMKYKHNLVGEKFGKLQVLEFYKIDKKGCSVWKCLCNCGEVVFKRRGYLRESSSLSCGCIEKEKRSKDLSGKQFGRLTAVKPVEQTHKKEWIWLCTCECGNEAKVPTSRLQTKTGTRSCGCSRKKLNAVKSTKFVWRKMIDRCYNSSCPNYKDYGGRGITVCDRWLNSFDAFLEDMGEKPKNLTIERKDNSKNYSPENCKWATRKEQANNRRCNRLFSLNGKTQSLKQWSEELDISYNTLFARVKNGCPEDDLFKYPKSKKDLSKKG